MVSIQEGFVDGIRIIDIGNGEIAIAFRPDFFGDYVRNLEELHQLGESLREVEVVEQVVPVAQLRYQHHVNVANAE